MFHIEHRIYHYNSPCYHVYIFCTQLLTALSFEIALVGQRDQSGVSVRTAEFGRTIASLNVLLRWAAGLQSSPFPPPSADRGTGDVHGVRRVVSPTLAGVENETGN